MRDPILRVLVGVLVVSVATAPGLFAQTPLPSFEVASIKPTGAGTGIIGGACHGTDRDPGVGMAGLAAAGASTQTPSIPLGRCVLRRMSLAQIIQLAYSLPLQGLNADTLAGGPAWLTSDRFDVEAKAEQPTTEARLKLMLQSLLVDRFQLAFHLETRQAAGYALVVGAKGVTVQPAAGNEDRKGIFRSGPGPWTGRNASMAELARILGGSLGRPVVDETGLSGGYNFTLTWTPGESERSPFGLPPGALADLRARGLAEAADPSGPSIFTAVQEQLGLRLEAKSVPREVFVVDHVEQPSAN